MKVHHFLGSGSDIQERQARKQRSFEAKYPSSDENPRFPALVKTVRLRRKSAS